MRELVDPLVPSEMYNDCIAFANDAEACCAAVERLPTANRRVVLFVILKPDIELDDPLRERIKKQIRVGASPRHVPNKIVQVADIPRSKSGKISELAVRDIVHGRDIKNREALANPEAISIYRNMAELAR